MKHFKLKGEVQFIPIHSLFSTKQMLRINEVKGNGDYDKAAEIDSVRLTLLCFTRAIYFVYFILTTFIERELR